MRNLIGADAAGVLPQLDRHDFTFLIEDPATVWHLGPKRYPQIATSYGPLTPHTSKLAIDINIVERYQDVYPTKQQTGTELFQLVSLASRTFPRVALYFENSILAPDLPLLASAAVAPYGSQRGDQERLRRDARRRVFLPQRFARHRRLRPASRARRDRRRASFRAVSWLGPVSSPGPTLSSGIRAVEPEKLPGSKNTLLTHPPLRHNLPMPRRIRHVALIYDARTVYDLKVMTGVAAYLQEGADWRVYIEENALKDQRLPDLRSWRGDGIIANFDDPRVATAVMDSQLPVVAFGSDYGWFKSTPRIPYFVTNNEAIAQMAADYLLDRGFVRFAYCGYPRTPATVWAEEREHAFADRIRKRNFPCWTYRGRHRTSRKWDSFQRSLCAWLESLAKPLGLMAANDSRARQVLEACRRAGLRVPEEVAVLGVDNDEMVCQLSSPLLSSIEQGARRIGYEAAVLLDKIMSGKKPRQSCFAIDPVGIVQRRSTDVLAIEDPQVANAMAFISEHVCDGINAQNVADALGLPRPWLDARFKALVNRSMYAQILHFRLEHTKRLISATNLPLKQVAANAGFKSVQHMTILFSKAFGRPPADYRRTVAANPVLMPQPVPSKTRGESKKNI